MEVLKLWDVETGICKHTFGDDGFIVSFCSWFPDSKCFVCGSSDPKKGIYMWNCNGNEINAWRGIRMPKVLDLAVTPDGENLISIFSDKEIRILNVTTSAEHVIFEQHSITSLSVSGDSKFLIVNLNSQEIHMWDVAGKWLKPTQYNGHRQQKYVIRSCFGGFNGTFIASGSENSKVYIWNRRNSNPIEVLSGHLMTVNCISLNPRRPKFWLQLVMITRYVYGDQVVQSKYMVAYIYVNNGGQSLASTAFPLYISKLACSLLNFGM